MPLRPPLPEPLYPGAGMWLAALLLALLLDHLYPYHRGFLLAIHPVHTSYVMARRLGRPGSSRLRGALVWAAVVAVHLTPYGLALWLSWRLSPLLWLLAAGYTLKVSFSLRLLLDTVRRVAVRSSRGEWGEARYWAQQLVRRNVYELDGEHVLSAAVESLAESLVDGFTSPLLYYLVLGPLGALLQRVVNTLDGALGFKTGGYREVGWFSAKADTLVNFLPARLTALLIAVSSPLAGGKGFTWVVSVWRRYHSATESLNAGHPMSAMAGALGVRLEKPGHYTLGDPVERLTPGKVFQALRIAWTAALLTLLLLSTLRLALQAV